MSKPPAPLAEAGAAPGRLHEMDALRSLLMLLGVVVHAADPYAVATRWLVRDPHGHIVFDRLIDAIHRFRMPTFFLIGGFFAMLLLRRQPAPAFLRDRGRRLGVPFLATLFSLNLLQVAWLGRDGAAADGFLAGALWPAWRDGHWIGHLWFLPYLLVYGVLAAALAPCLRCGWPAWQALPANSRTALLTCAGITAALLPPTLAHGLPALSRWTLGGALDPLEWLTYLPFFAAGLLLEGDADAWLRFARLDGAVLAMGLGGWSLSHLGGGHGGLTLKFMHALAGAALTWASVRVVLAASRRWLGRPSAAWRYLSDASYSVYLLHHLVVVVAATLLLPLRWAVSLKFALVCGLATALPLAIHHVLILRQPWLRWLFNGKRRPRSVRESRIVTADAPP